MGRVNPASDLVRARALGGPGAPVVELGFNAARDDSVMALMLLIVVKWSLGGGIRGECPGFAGEESFEAVGDLWFGFAFAGAVGGVDYSRFVVLHAYDQAG